MRSDYAIEVNSKKIVWAVDAFDTSVDKDRATQFINRLNPYLHNAVEPVFVLTPHNVRVRPDYFAKWIDVYKESANRALNALDRKRLINGLLAPRILVSDGSRNDDVDTLLSYCEDEKVGAIIVSSPTTEGYMRFFRRSFTETLLLRSQVPVVVLNRLTALNNPITRIIFPTDFKEDGLVGFQAALKLAKSLDASVTIYFKNQVPLYLASQGSPYFHLFFEEEVNQSKKVAREWVAIAQKDGIDCSYEINENVYSGKIGECIVNFARFTKADLIFMVSKSTAVEAFFGNSIARYIIRKATCPVLLAPVGIASR